MKTLGIYVQVPFCQTKCTYCNFHTGVVSSARFAPYVSCVCSEIAGHRGLYEAAGIALPAASADAAVDRIYIGGGRARFADSGPRVGIAGGTPGFLARGRCGGPRVTRACEGARDERGEA